MHFLLMYELAEDYLERRPQFRGVHLALAQAAQARGDMVLAGALTDPADMAILLFQGDNPAAAEAFAAADPYVTEGLVKQWRVRPWHTVIGTLAAHPLPPA
jgi:uncharacterized protein YciI